MEPGEAPEQAQGASGVKTPRKQASLTRLWSFSPKTPATEPPSSHKKLRASPFETAESADCFYKDLEAKRLQAAEDEKDSPSLLPLFSLPSLLPLSSAPLEERRCAALLKGGSPLPLSSRSAAPRRRCAARRRELRARLMGPFYTTTTIPA